MLKTIKQNIFTCIYLSLLTFVSFVISSPIYFATNDDGIMSKIANGSYSKFDREVLIYSSQILGKVNKYLYTNSFEIEWFGILQAALVFTVTYYFVSKLKKKRNGRINNFFRYLLLIFISLIYMNFISSPSFTITSIILGIAALSIFVEYNVNNNINNKKIIYFIFLFYLTFSYLTRPDGFLLIIYILLVILLILLLIKKLKINSINIKFIIAIFLFSFIIILNMRLDGKLVSEKYNWKNYFTSKELISSIHTNPSNIEMNLLINSQQIQGLKWTSVESTLLQKLIIFDNSEFSNSNLEKAIKEVKKFQGLEGLINYNFEVVSLRLIDYLKPVSLNLILFLATIIFIIINLKSARKYYLIILPLSYLIFFYILSAVLRLPERITIPLLTMTAFSSLFVLYMLKPLNNKINNWLGLFIMLFLIIGTTFTKYGIINNKFENEKKFKISSEINNSLKKVNQNGIFIGDIEYFNENFKLAYSRENSNLPLQLPSGWLTFSPHWVYKLQSLKLIGNNPLLAIAQQENVYWVSNLYFSQVIDMYMNDHMILRKERCEIVDLPRDGYVISFQLLKTECQSTLTN